MICTCNHQLQPHERTSVCPRPPTPMLDYARQMRDEHGVTSFIVHPSALTDLHHELDIEQHWTDLGGEG